MGAIIDMNAPHKVAFYAEITTINVIFRNRLKPAVIGTTFQPYILLA